MDRIGGQINDKMEVFKLIQQLKNIKKDFLIVGIKTQLWMAKMYFKHKVWKNFTFIQWKRGLIMYCLDNFFTWREAVEQLQKEKIIE